ncbi:glycosyltransferase family 4 protein [Bradyrhizobium erythrophlei]|uniref:Glycosyltransferase involved in cell wall bisynthesis n=1 Tax=Bradyrhizobium erythrophlei TaxID=1437360 RepID=A0A1M5PC73_9BRAD|nr:glycosyltransferase family 4 protein [Bradyrhizobium erythrophlei]SHG99348.1 Glycosyltransferase involved in cell wall bisynthesis [Bradyrhizobium erythrophlei]
MPDHLTIKSAQLASAKGPIEAADGGVRLRVAYMTGEYPRATDTFIQREVAALRALGHHVQTFSVRTPPASENVEAEILAGRKSTIYLLPPQGLIIAHLAQVFSSPGRYFAALALAWNICPPGIRAMARQVAYFAEAAMLVRLIRKHDLSHLHNHFADSSCSVAVIAAAMGEITYSFTIHGPTEFFEPKYWRIDEKVRRALFVNCISHFCRSQVMLFAPLDCWKKLRIVHCGVDPEAFEVKRHQGRGGRLLFVGRLAAIKGLPIILEVLARLEDVTLDIVGDGPDRQLLEEQARLLNISSRVRFLGYQSQQHIRGLFKQADVFVMSSFAEGVPVVLMEAMAAGIPVVAPRIAGIPELVRDGQSGLLVAPGDVNEMASAVDRLLRDAGLRNRFAIAARHDVERDFNIQTESRWLAEIVSSAIAGRSIGIRP